VRATLYPPLDPYKDPNNPLRCAKVPLDRPAHRELKQDDHLHLHQWQEVQDYKHLLLPGP
jgi:hypothetical protein